MVTGTHTSRLRPLNTPITAEALNSMLKNGEAEAKDLAHALATTDEFSPEAATFFRSQEPLVADAFVAALDSALLGFPRKPLKATAERPTLNAPHNFTMLEDALRRSGDQLLEQLDDTKKLSPKDQLRVHEMYEAFTARLIEDMRELVTDLAIPSRG